MKISFGGGHDHATLVSSPTLNAAGDAPCLSLGSGEEDSIEPDGCFIAVSKLDHK